MIRLAISTLAAGVAAMFWSAASAADCPKAGVYTVSGTTPEGQPYSGRVQVAVDAGCRLRWKSPDGSIRAVSLQGGGLFGSVTRGAGKGQAVFEREANGIIQGSWWMDDRVDLVGTETLAPPGVKAAPRVVTAEADPSAPVPRSEPRAPSADLVASDSAALSGTQKVKSLSARLTGIDDIGFALLVGPRKGERAVIASAEWVAGQGVGAGSGDVGKALFGGRSLLIFGIHNKAFAFGAGKWTYGFQLVGDGQEVWSASGGQRGGGVGVQYWKAFTVRREGGAIAISEPSAAEQARANAIMAELNEGLVEKFGRETSSVGLAAGLLAAGMTSGGGGGSSGRDAYDEYDDQRNNSSSSSSYDYDPPETSSGLYGNCHGGAAYGC